MRIRLVIFASAFLTASCITPGTVAASAPMTVAYVEQHLKDLHGKTIRMQGEVNNCTSLTCKICDGPDKADACLGLALYADSDEARDVVEELYRFATITIDARIDASCRLGYDPDEQKERSRDTAANQSRDIVLVCTDRASVVEDARVVSVDRRKPASLGRFDMYIGDPLKEADAAAQTRIRQVLIGLPGVGETDVGELRVYADPERFEDSTEGYIICECLKDSCENQWPTWSGQSYARSPANPYVCTFANKFGDNWLLSR